MAWLYFYWSLIALVALPCALFLGNKVAGVVAGVCIVAFGLIVAAELPMVWTYLVLHLIGFVLGARYARTATCLCAVTLFAPLATMDLTFLMGGMSESQWWWAVYALALAQVVILPLADLPQVQRHTKGITERWQRFTRDAGGFFAVPA